MIVPAYLDLVVYRNGSDPFDITLQDKAVGNFDCTGFGPIMEVRSARGAQGDPIIRFTPVANGNGSSITFTDLTIPSLSILIDQADRANQTLFKFNGSTTNTYWYDVLLVNSSGKPDPYFGGKFILTEGVTVP